MEHGIDRKGKHQTDHFNCISSVRLKMETHVFVVSYAEHSLHGWRRKLKSKFAVTLDVFRCGQLPVQLKVRICARRDERLALEKDLGDVSAAVHLHTVRVACCGEILAV